MSTRRTITEAEVRRVVLRAWKKAWKIMESEPDLIIMIDDNNNSLSDETLHDIQRWLFDKR